MKQATIIWCTGMSGVGKSTLAEHAKAAIEQRGEEVLILDGDVIRDNYHVKLGFGRDDVRKNNLNVAEICLTERSRYDLIIVPIISPIDTVRRELRRRLSPDFHLVYVHASVGALRERDPKGLYGKADSGEICDLIGYSESNPYDTPTDYELMIDTSDPSTLERSKGRFLAYVLDQMAQSVEPLSHTG